MTRSRSTPPTVADIDATIAALTERQRDLAARVRTLGADEAECRAELARAVAYGSRQPSARAVTEIQQQLAAIANEREASVEADRLLGADLERLRAERTAAVRVEAEASLASTFERVDGIIAALRDEVLAFARDIVAPRMAEYEAAADAVRAAKSALGMGWRLEDPAPTTWQPLPGFPHIAQQLAAYVSDATPSVPVSDPAEDAAPDPITAAAEVERNEAHRAMLAHLPPDYDHARGRVTSNTTRIR